MRIHTQSFKDEIKEFGREFDDNLYYTNNGTTTTYGQEHINSVNYYYDTSLLKSVMQTLEIDTDLNLQLNNKIDYGCSLLNDEVRFNNFNIIKKEDQKDTKSYRYTCYDNMVKMMIDYVSIREYTSTTDVTFDDDKTYYQWDNQEQTYVIYTGSTTGNPHSLNLYEDTTYPTNVRTLLQRLCDYVGITFANASDTFTNYDKVIDSEHYSTYDSTKHIWENIGYTCRDILDDLAEATGSFIVINNNGELELKYPTTTNDTVDENYFSENNVSIGKHYGPINVVVLSRAGVDDLYYPQTLPQNPCEIKINNNPILEQTNREDFIQGIYNAINGLEFYLNDFNSTGIMYYEVGDLYNVSIDSTTYPCLMLNDNIKRNDGLSEIIHTDEPQTSVTDFKYASPTDRLELTARNAYIRADKAEGKVEAVVSAIGDDNGDVTSASLILAINENNDPTIKLEAKQVYINGVTFDSSNNMTINQGTINIEQGPGDRSLYTYYDDNLMNEFDEAELLPLGLYITRTDNTTQQVTDYANYGVYETYIQDSAGNKLDFLPSRLSLYDSNSNETFSVDTATGNTTTSGHLAVNGNLQPIRYIDSDFVSSFKNDIFNNSSTGGLEVIRKSGTWASDYFKNYSCGLAFMGSDQGGFIIPTQNDRELNVGGVSNGVVSWYDKAVLEGNIKMNSWTPQLACVGGETAPTYTTTSVRGYYTKIGKIVFINFYIRGKITALNGTNNYALIKNLPYTPTSSIGFGMQNCTIGTIYSCVNSSTNLNFVIDTTGIRIQQNYGAGATKWIVTSTNYMEFGGSGWYYTD